ncbi:uncharacterized protein LOC129592211 [Paramacrobiotus metropolitanus]|uniref:uncharacterized protein LOC129592211 n=1 Tax=Paramacrobiotus metropolitanus TaxID=2943436 RepID=UPI00244579AB|nr:uncharacterized protein LOC129592211 [Paramacrobiotus metropolitanus]XP_055344154.1 uncharacterized protein LOC129592211 [Paramacrobiotus metropolitanus]XP_055344155.1 uncharacterized protein LOC129592211 [Paramacrobiotus metropolitanus]XP_055344156.1 uncharacterized protein LOC129592211 [Paramacrobiotus metropolitanus]XP_055344157.1 uncharacterized protein LOC129592211 [Paramacrobiotus metropolitanus]
MEQHNRRSREGVRKMRVSVALTWIWLIFHAATCASGTPLTMTVAIHNSTTPSPADTPVNTTSFDDFLYDCGEECWRKHSLFNKTIFQPNFPKLKTTAPNTTVVPDLNTTAPHSSTNVMQREGKLEHDDPYASREKYSVPSYQGSMSLPWPTPPAFYRGSNDLQYRTPLTKASVTFTPTIPKSSTTVTTRLPTTFSAKPIKNVTSESRTTPSNNFTNKAKLLPVTQRRTSTPEPEYYHHMEEQAELLNANHSVYYLLTLNGSCHEIEESHEAAEGFVQAFSKALLERFETLTVEDVHVWSIACGSVIVNFSMPTWEHANHFGYLHQRIVEGGNFSVYFTEKVYRAVALTRTRDDMADEQTLAHLQIAPSSGRFYPGVIYVVVGALVGLALLVIATIFIVRLHRRRGREFSISLTSDQPNPPKLSSVNAQDYTLTRLPRTTKLFMSDMERNPWAYTNPDFQASLPSLHAPGRKTEYLNFVNHGVIPSRQRLSSPDSSSSLTKNPLLQVTHWGQRQADASMSTATSTAPASSTSQRERSGHSEPKSSSSS